MSFDVNNSAYDEGRSGRLSYPSNGDTAAFRRGQDVAWKPSSTSTSTLNAEQSAAFLWLIWIVLKAGTWLALFALAFTVQAAMLVAHIALYGMAQLRRFRSARLRRFVIRWIEPASAALDRGRRHTMNLSIAVLTSIF